MRRVSFDHTTILQEVKIILLSFNFNHLLELYVKIRSFETLICVMCACVLRKREMTFCMVI